MAVNYYVLISKNEEGKVVFDELITHFAETLEEAEDFVLDTINPWIDGKFEDTEDLAEYLITLDDENGFSPLFEINKIENNESKEDEELILRLPCKEGTTVYCIGCCGEICDNFDIDCSFCIDHDIVFTTSFDRNMLEQFGKTVFLTEEEATKKLITDKLEELNSKVGTSELDKYISAFTKHYLSLLPKEHQHLDFGLYSNKYVITDGKGARVI